MDARPFYEQPGLNTETYDPRTHLLTRGGLLDGDVDWHLGLARRAGGPVLELGCGTGRVTWALARAGFAVTGLERSPAMMALAQAKRASATGAACELARFELGDMRRPAVEGPFGLIIAPFRAFQSLLTPEDQRACLESARRLLRADGLLALNLFDPKLELLGPVGSGIGHRASVEHPVTGHVVTAETVERENDPLAQTFREVWRFREHDGSGSVVREEHEELRMRWTLRQELRWLLELCGLEVVSDNGDYHGGPPRYGGEILVVARPR